ncbi:MAG: methionine--tRNA ligase [Desulfatirhabdiaceae bacterium]
MSIPFYITTPIYYVNAPPHLGHAYTSLVADVAARFHRMLTCETWFLTGTDEHGDKIIRAAAEKHQSPREYVDSVSRLFQNLWPQLNIAYDGFIRTTDPDHIAVVCRILQRIYDAGDIYFSEYEGLYCFGCERFYTERELVDGKCPDHETFPEKIQESNYFFRMSRYQDWLINHITRNPDFIRPERYRNEVLAFLREPLEDLCISRPKTRLNWGISLPFDDRYVTYVWFDALLNYVSALGYPDGALFEKFWPHAQHIVAKDILKPHGIYWPIILKAAGIPLYQHLNVHGYWNVDRSKMSKSLGNVIEPLALKDRYGLDPFRYFLMREMVFGLDSGFSESALVTRINADLANDLGNLFSRVVAMVHKYFKGVVPDVSSEMNADMAMNLKEAAQTTITEFEIQMKSFAFHRALASVWEFINQMNKYIDVTQPWLLAKSKSTHRQLEIVLYHLLDGLRIVSGLIYPIMPNTAAVMQRHLGLNPSETYYHLKNLKTWGMLPSGSIVPKSITLFPRIEIKPESAENQQDTSAEIAMVPIKPEISIDDVKRVDLRVATVIHAEALPKANRLLKLEVDMGERRTIVAGIAKSYSPETLIGKQIIIVANLKPAKLMGIVSQGMLLAAVDEGTAVVGTTDTPVKPGTPLS